MQRKKLLKLADFLENVVTDSRFDLGKWQGFGDRTKHQCKTVACAFGWCPTVWPRSGLKNHSFGVTYEPNKKTSDYCSNFEAAARFFGITLEQSRYLFSSEKYSIRYRGRISVAKRIRKFAEGGGVVAV